MRLLETAQEKEAQAKKVLIDEANATHVKIVYDWRRNK